MNPASDPPSLLFVRKLEVLTRFAAAEREGLINLPIVVRTIEAGRDIVREGEFSKQSVLILDGWLCRYKVLPSGARQVLSVHVPGDVPDLMSLHLRLMDHSIMAMTEVKVGFMSHESLDILCSEFPRIATALWKETLIDASIFREWMVGLGRRSATQRVGHFMCEIYLRLQVVGLAKDHKCAIPMTQSDMADAFGLSLVHLNRTLKELKEAGLISLRHQTLAILNWHGLVKACDFDPAYLHFSPQIREG
jgi:CRP-like cAMP-binding protein